MDKDKQKALLLLALIALPWLALGVLDWTLRFTWFQFKDTLMWTSSASISGPFEPGIETTKEAYDGGDLTKLLGDPALAAELSEHRPASINYTDAYGYRNRPPIEDAYELLLVGDSFMNTGIPMTNMFSAWLETYAERPVYNHAFPARGPFMGLVRYIVGERFKDPAPFVIWGLLERDLSGVAFDGMRYQLWANETQTGLRWYSFLPKELRKSLPNSSILAQLSRRIWNRLSYRTIEKRVFSAVVSEPVDGKPYLFFGPSLDAMRWTEEQRDITGIVRSLVWLKVRMDKAGIPFCLLLIPDKANVYREYLPDDQLNGDPPLRFEFLNDLEAAAQAQGLHVVNLLEPFREAASRGEQLYFRDDTHWNPKGVSLAAELTWEFLKPMVEKKPEQSSP